MLKKYFGLNSDVLLARPVKIAIGNLSKPRRRRQRERHQAKGLMSKTTSVHVGFKSLYISLPSSTKKGTWNDQVLRRLRNAIDNG